MLEGAYSLLILTNDGYIYAIRDPTGCKPLCYGMLEINDMKFYIFSSESCSLDVLGANLIDDVKPGEIIKIHPEKEIQKFFIKSNKRVGVCHFEYVYFARPDSIIDGISVGETRFRLGMNLAKDDDLNISNAVVVPVPDSGRSAAMGYSWYSGIPYEEGLMKNRYIWQLKANPKEKLNPIKSVVNGKNIILVDDSILSGETMKDIIRMLREAGAKSIHVRISCPPIIKSCKLLENEGIKNLTVPITKFMVIAKDNNGVRAAAFFNGSSNKAFHSELLSHGNNLLRKITVATI